MKNELIYQKKNFYELFGTAEKKAAHDYAVGYTNFLDKAKTEREAVSYAVAKAEANGFLPYSFGMKLNVGGKYYFNNREKNLFLFTIGKEPLENGFRISAAHVDSPRLDLKPCPLYEEGGMSFLKTHYYGGIRKYQWVTVPLALHGVVIKADGTSVDKGSAIVMNDSGVTEYVLTVTDDVLCGPDGADSTSAATHTLYFTLTATKTSIQPPVKVAEPGGTPLLVVKSKNSDWSCAIPALEGTQIKYYSKTQKD